MCAWKARSNEEATCWITSRLSLLGTVRLTGDARCCKPDGGMGGHGEHREGNSSAIQARGWRSNRGKPCDARRRPAGYAIHGLAEACLLRLGNGADAFARLPRQRHEEVAAWVGKAYLVASAGRADCYQCRIRNSQRSVAES